MLATHLTTNVFPPGPRTHLSTSDHLSTFNRTQLHVLHPTTLHSRPRSILSKRSTASFASTSSAASFTTTGDRNRHSAALLDLDLDDATLLSLQRANEILRASERAREKDKRSLRWRDPVLVGQASPTALRAEQTTSADDEAEQLCEAAFADAASRRDQRRTVRRFSPKQFLLRASSPKESSVHPVISSPRALAPSPLRQPSLAHSVARARVPVRDRSPSHKLVEKSSVAFASLRADDPHLASHIVRPLAEASAPPAASGVAPSSSDAACRDDHDLSNEGSSINHASGGGLKSLRSRLAHRATKKAPGGKPVRKKTSLASLFGFRSAAEESSASDTRRPQEAILRTSNISSSETSGHRPSTSVSSYAPSSSTSGSRLASSGSSRFRFFRPRGQRNSDASQRASEDSHRNRSSPGVSTLQISGPIPLSPARRQPLATTSVSEPLHSLPVPEASTWKARIGRAIQGKNVAAKLALFEKPVAGPEAMSTSTSATDTQDLTLRPIARAEFRNATPDRPPSPVAFGRSDVEGSMKTRTACEAQVKARAAAFDALAIQSPVRRVRPRSNGVRSPVSAPHRALNAPAPAGSPQKDARGLPAPFDASLVRNGSPKKHALGPEHANLFQHGRTATGPINRVRGATSDLAELLGGFEDTRDLNASPRKDTISQATSPTVDVPGDLRSLISEVDEQLTVQLDDMAGLRFADEPTMSSSASSSLYSSSSSSSEDEAPQDIDHFLYASRAVPGPHPHFLAPPFSYTTQFSSDDGEPTRAFEPTSSSFEDHCSSAAAALRKMLSTDAGEGGGSPPASATLRRFASQPSATLRPFQLWGRANGSAHPSPPDSASRRDAGDFVRPTAGEKMFELDETVPLSPLVSGSSPARSLRLSVQRGCAPPGQPDSPTPLPSGGWHPRTSLSRYSQDHHHGSRHSHSSGSISVHSIDSSGQSVPQDMTECSLALSSQSTELSLSSVLSSPCPAPRQRRVPMLTGHRERRFSFRLSLDNIQDEGSQKVDEQGPTHFEGEFGTTVDPVRAVAVAPALSPRHESVLHRATLCAASPSSPQSLPESSEDVATIEDSSAAAMGSARRVESLRLYCSLAHEAETEIKRSLVVWPDTEFSREMVARFLAPRTYFGILKFLRSSLHLFPSPSNRCFPAAFSDSPSPIVSDTSDFPATTLQVLQTSKIRWTRGSDDAPNAVAPLIDVGKSSKPAGRPLRTALLEKSVNAPSASGAGPLKAVRLPLHGGEEEAPSPFTALPPRLRMRRPSGMSKCDTGFLGDKVTWRRQGQFDAAMRRLEGCGAPDEQRSGGETDDTGVLEAHGEATQELSFSLSPRVTNVRPRARPRTALSMIR